MLLTGHQRKAGKPLFCRLRASASWPVFRRNATWSDVYKDGPRRRGAESKQKQRGKAASGSVSRAKLQETSWA